MGGRTCHGGSDRVGAQRGLSLLTRLLARWTLASLHSADYAHERIQLEVLDTLTNEVSILTDDSAIYTDPVFSPDGSKIAYVSTQPNGYFNLYVRGFDNGNWQALRLR